MLSAPARVVFVVRGPAPSCAVVGRIRVRGRRGTNEFRFTGRIGKRRLPAGTYRIAARTRAGKAAKPIAVVVGSGPLERPRCARGGAAGTAVIFDGLMTPFDGGNQPPASTRDDDAGGVLPGIKDRIGRLPKALPKPPLGGFTEPGGSGLTVVELALAGLVLCGLVVIAYAVRHMRRSRFYY